MSPEPTILEMVQALREHWKAHPEERPLTMPRCVECMHVVGDCEHTEGQSPFPVDERWR